MTPAHILAHTAGYILTLLATVVVLRSVDSHCTAPVAPSDPWMVELDSAAPTDPWGPCSATDTDCPDGSLCWTQPPELGMCVLEPPCPSEVQVDDETFVPVDHILGCPLPCERDRDCLPDRGMMCGEAGSCGWKARI
jgi:hypothetical protein